MALARRFLQQPAELFLFFGGQLLQREADRRHGSVVEARFVAEAEGRVPRRELLSWLEVAGTLPSLSSARISYQLLGERVGSVGAVQRRLAGKLLRHDRPGAVQAEPVAEVHEQGETISPCL